MTHEEYIKRRDEIVKWVSPTQDLNRPVESQALQAIDELVLAVIGENGEYVDISIESSIDNHEIAIRNVQKNDQRSIVKGSETKTTPTPEGIFRPSREEGFDE